MAKVDLISMRTRLDIMAAAFRQIRQEPWPLAVVLWHCVVIRPRKHQRRGRAKPVQIAHPVGFQDNAKQAELEPGGTSE